MSLDEISVSIGRLQAAFENTVSKVTSLETEVRDFKSSSVRLAFGCISSIIGLAATILADRFLLHMH
jgi:hypothetical protein